MYYFEQRQQLDALTFLVTLSSRQGSFDYESFILISTTSSAIIDTLLSLDLMLTNCYLIHKNDKDSINHR